MSKDEISIPPILKIERGVTAHIGEYLKGRRFYPGRDPFRKRTHRHVRRYGLQIFR